MSDYVDCGDNGCLCCPPEQMKGMRTNGGCRCFRHGNFMNLSAEERGRIYRAVMYWRDRAIGAEHTLRTLTDAVDIDPPGICAVPDCAESAVPGGILCSTHEAASLGDLDMTSDKRRRAAEVVQELIRDIRDRQELKEQWDGLGSDVKKKIRFTWERIVKRGLR
jgi:hypothetical protein